MKSSPQADVPIPITVDKFETARKQLPPFMQDIVVMPEKQSTMFIPSDDAKRYIKSSGLNKQWHSI